MKVAVLMGSPNDRDKMQPAVDTLEAFGLPVVGVPLSGGAINGVDALYSTVQMPKGIPVATFAIDGSMNAALLVVEMLAITDSALADALAADREKRASA